MSQRREKKIRRLERRVADLEDEIKMLHIVYGQPEDADYAPIPTGHKPGFFRRLWRKIFE